MRKPRPALTETRARERAGDLASAGSRPAAAPRITAARIRRAVARDIPQVIDIDERVTSIAKPDYWRDVFDRYGNRRLGERFFLVAEESGSGPSGALLGFVVGEVRAWEFGSAPCGWVFAFSVDPAAREQRIGEQLFEAISADFKAAGISTMRTMVARDNQLHLAFFRGEGMMAGRYIQLEKELD